MPILKEAVPLHLMQQYFPLLVPQTAVKGQRVNVHAMLGNTRREQKERIQHSFVCGE